MPLNKAGSSNLTSFPQLALNPFSSSSVAEALKTTSGKKARGENHLDQPKYLYWYHPKSLERSSCLFTKVSKLPCLSKILESLVNNQLKFYLAKYAFLSPYQCGFRTEHSTTPAAVPVLNYVVSIVDNKMHCAAPFVLSITSHS